MSGRGKNDSLFHFELWVVFIVKMYIGKLLCIVYCTALEYNLRARSFCDLRVTTFRIENMGNGGAHVMR